MCSAMLGPNRLMHKPTITNVAALIFHSGKDSPNISDEAAKPNTGTSKVNGATVAAG